MYDPFASLPTYPEQPPEPPAGASRYCRLFAVHEIAASPPLQWLSAALLISFFLTFHEWARATDITIAIARAGDHQCWPWFQDCGRYYFLSALPRAYSQTTVYALMFTLAGMCALAIWRGRWVAVHALTLALFAWKTFVFLMTTRYAANFHYFHLLFTFLFLFGHYKLFFLRRCFVLLYFLAGVLKLDGGWIVGTYFSSLRAGLPLIPDQLIPLATNTVIVLELVAASFLLSGDRRRQRIALVALTLFHLYSGILVMYRYPTMVLGPLLCLYGPWIAKMPSPFSRRSLVGWMLIVALVCGQAVSYIIPGDVRLTLEGNTYGLFMFEANHQCRSSTRLHLTDGTIKDWRHDDRTHAHNRCDPYAKWFRIQQICARADVASVEWKFDHSVNGAPFRRIVDARDGCKLEFEPLVHNPWIRTEAQADVVGRPVENIY